MNKVNNNHEDDPEGRVFSQFDIQTMTVMEWLASCKDQDIIRVSRCENGTVALQRRQDGQVFLGLPFSVG